MRKRRLSKALAMFLAAALTIPAAVPVAASESTADKEETVYVKTDANGEEKTVIVSDWLKNFSGEAKIKDATDLTDVENVKGNETYKRGKKDNITWNAKGNDIYYQGTSDKNLPVSMKVTYYLDGKEISPKKLVGKSGKVKIRYEYENHSAVTKTINGKQTTIYTPFTMITAAILNTDNFSNVKATNGKVISDGNKHIVIGVAMPGLADSLNLKNTSIGSNFDIPEDFEITADVEDFQMTVTATVANSDTLSEFGLDDAGDLSELTDSLKDLAEEVARFYGYDNIPVTLPNGESTAGKKPFKIRVEDVCRNVAEQNGFCGGMTYSFESPKVFDKLLLAEDAKERQAIEISNPLGEDFSIMRTVSLNGMLTSLSTNLAHRNKNVRLYEFGNIYIPKALPLTELPDERMQMTLGMYGECDFFTLKGVVEDMLDSLGLGGRSEYAPTGEHPFLHPGRAADVTIDGEKIAYIGQIHPEVMDNYNMKGEVYVAVIDMPTLVPKATFDRKYEGVAKFPAMKRDLSMVMKKDIFVGQLEKIFKDKGGKLLESYELFDVYEGDQIEKGYKSVAYSLTFRAKDRTLEDAEVSKIVEKILDELKKLGVELRA